MRRPDQEETPAPGPEPETKIVLADGLVYVLDTKRDDIGSLP